MLIFYLSCRIRFIFVHLLDSLRSCIFFFFFQRATPEAPARCGFNMRGRSGFDTVRTGLAADFLFSSIFCMKSLCYRQYWPDKL